MTDYVKTAADGYVRDIKSNVVINNNMAELELFRARRAQIEQIRSFEQRFIRLEAVIQQLNNRIEQLEKR